VKVLCKGRLQMEMEGEGSRINKKMRDQEKREKTNDRGTVGMPPDEGARWGGS